VGAGLAYSAKMSEKDYRTYVIVGDGESYEGSIWESAMFAGHQELSNLIAIVDRNGLCATDFTENILRQEPYSAKWAAFGWEVLEVDGHDIAALLRVFAAAHASNSTKPVCIIANTIKGKGADFMINNPLMHGVAPANDNIQQAFDSLAREEEEYMHEWS
jgi:transketolase